MANEPNSPSIQVHHGDTEIAEKDANPSIQQLYVPSSVSSVSRWWISPAWTQAPGRLAVANEANLSDWGLEIADWGLAAVGSRERQTNPIGRGPGDCFATLAMTVVEPKVAWGGRAKRSQFAEAGRGWRKCVNLVPLRRMMPVSPCCYIKDMERMIPRRENLGTVLEWIRK